MTSLYVAPLAQAQTVWSLWRWLHEGSVVGLVVFPLSLRETVCLCGFPAPKQVFETVLKVFWVGGVVCLGL